MQPAIFVPAHNVNIFNLCQPNTIGNYRKEVITIPGYEDILNISGTGIMGYVSIPNINVELPIYHGTSEGALQIASGHIQGSSLPVGGASTHAVISGHRGLPSAKLFTDLDQIVEGDTFTITTEEPPSTEPTTEDKTDDFLQNGLQFYGSPDTERRKMSAYTQLYEYRTEEPGQPWELIMEYENVPYFGKNCDGVLCFTSLGLVGINYFDSNTSDYNFWVQSLTELYGTPDDTQYDYTAWSSAPVGSGTMIYVFALEDGVQISFFADDTGSELT